MEKLKILLLALMFALSTIGVRAIDIFKYTANGREWRVYTVENENGRWAVIVGVTESASTCSGVLNFPDEVIDNNGKHFPVMGIGGYGIFDPVTKYTFEDYSLITEVNLPNSVKAIHGKTFARCTGLITVNIPSVEVIASEAFDGCANLTHVNGAPEKIGDAAFRNCLNLSAVNITNVEDLGTYAFFNDGAITSITFNPHLKKIPSDAFSKTSITSLTIPADVIEIGTEAFKDCASLASINFEEGPTKGVAAILFSAFRNCTSLTSLTIPGKFKTIDVSAFLGCTNLTELHLQSGLEDIGDYAFKECTALSGDLTIPETVKRIKEGAFENCPFGGTLTMKAQRQPAQPIGLMSNPRCNSIFISDHRYSSNFSFNFSHIVLDGPEPSPLMYNADPNYGELRSIFRDNSIQSITINPSVKKLSAWALYKADLSNVSSFKIPATVEEIGANAFYGVKFPPSTHLTIPSTVAKVEDNAFRTSNIAELTIEAGGITDIPFSFCRDCSNLSRVNLPEGMKSIRYNAFSDCTSLTNISPLPSTITRIEDEAFFNCPIQSDAKDIIPSSLKYIGSGVFNSKGITGEVVLGQLELDVRDGERNPFLQTRVYGMRMGTYGNYLNGTGRSLGSWDNYPGLLYVDCRDCPIKLYEGKIGNPAYKFVRGTDAWGNTYRNFISASVNTLVYLPSESIFNNPALPTATFDQRFDIDENDNETGGDASNFIMDGKCKQFFVKDGLPYRVPFAFTAQTARYSRTFNVTTGKAVSTLYLPYPTDLPEGMCAYTLVKKNVHSDGEKTFVFREVPQGTRLSANKPYLVRITDGQPHKLPVMHNVAVPVSPSVDAAGQIGIEDSDWKFFGTTEKIDNAAAYAKKAYYLNDNKWWAVQNGVENDYIAPFRCFVSSPTGATASRSFLLVLEGDDDSNVTGINQLESETEKDIHSGKYPFYSIDGKLMGKDYNKLERGQIYIVNGKKFYKF